MTTQFSTERSVRGRGERPDDGRVPAGGWASLGPLMRRTMSSRARHNGPAGGRRDAPPTMSFAPEYVNTVLNENFEDAKALFLEPLLAIHGAHLVMLAERDIVSARSARTASATPSPRCAATRSARAAYDGSCEDLFFFVERLIAERVRRRVAGRLHTARSRNDIDMTMYRMRQRGFVLDLFDATLALRATLGGIAAAHLETVFAGAHAHAAAQPTTLAHYLLGVIEQLERDATRLQGGVRHTNRYPLGACAITGTGFPIDRERTSALLGFDGPTGNTYGSIATVDYLLESLSAAAVALVGLGRVVQDLLLWCTAEFRYLRLGDGFVQVEQHHAAEAQPGRAGARARRSAARRSARRRR